MLFVSINIWQWSIMIDIYGFQLNGCSFARDHNVNKQTLCICGRIALYKRRMIRNTTLICTSFCVQYILVFSRLGPK